jgi:hypothetical protein
MNVVNTINPKEFEDEVNEESIKSSLVAKKVS